MAVEEHEEPPRRERRTALEARQDHRVPHDFSAEALRATALVPEGARLTRRGEFVDLHDPACGLPRAG